MTAVFDRYPVGGGEMLLALALADFASDDGTRVYPGIKHLSQKTRQSERTVQYQLRSMEKLGWLILVNAGDGGKGQHREYRVDPSWIKGADYAPFERVQSTTPKGATDDTKGCNPQHQTVQPVAPTINHERTISEPLKNHQCDVNSYPADFEFAWSLYPARPGKSKKAAYTAWMARLKDKKTAEQMTAGVRAYAEWCRAMNLEPHYIKQPETFFGPKEFFLSEWPLPGMRAGNMPPAQNLRPANAPRIPTPEEAQDEWMRDPVPAHV